MLCPIPWPEQDQSDDDLEHVNLRFRPSRSPWSPRPQASAAAGPRDASSSSAMPSAHASICRPVSGSRQREGPCGLPEFLMNQPPQSLDGHDRLCVRVERSEEDPLITGMDRLGGSP